MNLSVKAISAGYGHIPILREINLTVEAGQIVTLIGSNGAGKSTLLKAISGLIEVSKGEIHFNGKLINQLSTVERMRLGIAHVPEGRQIFSGMTVKENLELGGYSKNERQNEDVTTGEILSRFPALRSRMADPAGNLSGGQQQMLAIGRGLMVGPKLLMLDEPSLGLSPNLVDEIFDMIVSLRGQGLSVLISEQNARASLAISDKGYVLESGRIGFSGSGADLLNSTEVADRYFGSNRGSESFTDDVTRNLSLKLSHLLVGSK